MSLLLMRKQIREKGLRTAYFDLARKMVEDTTNNCRWQALIVIGEFIETDPEAVWPVVCRYGVSEDDDMRAGVATVLLEHLLEHHQDSYAEEVERLSAESPLFADTRDRCWDFSKHPQTRSKSR